MRIAIIGSPRSGNTWLRSTLSTALDLELFAEHNWTSFPNPLPENCLIGIHWYREPNFQAFLRQNEVRVVALARHPLDVMLSILQFSRREPEIAQWLCGNADIPAGMYGTDPTDPVFIDWALSFGAENMLAVTYQWWHDPTSVRIRYEDLVASPIETFDALLAGLGAKTNKIESSLAEHGFAKFKVLPNRHGWQGVSGLFRTLFTAETANRIHHRHRPIFDALGYDAEVDEATSPESIGETWASLS